MSYLKIILLFLILVKMKSNSRPSYDNRTFHSQAVDKYIDSLEFKFKDKTLYKIFSNFYPNTLDTTIDYNNEKNETFIITGDIEAMWLRDSSLQIYPYLKHCTKDPLLANMIKGLFKKQISYIIFDPYANAFNKEPLQSPWFNDITYKRNKEGEFVKAMNENLWERKFELDSLIFPLFIMSKYYLLTGDYDIFNNKDFFNMLEIIISVVKKEERGTDEEDENGGPEYYFQRKIEEPTDSLHFGRGNPCKTCGLIKTSFRNSDDSTILSYNIPENCLLVSTFKLLIKCFNDEKMEVSIKNEFNSKFKETIENISNSVEKSIYEYGIIIDPSNNEKYFAFEVDGFGNTYFMDEPGYPNLISLPFFEFCSTSNEIYKNTRKRILSKRNPYFITGKYGQGCSSSHSYRRYNWPLFTIMQGLTSINKNEKENCLKMLVVSAGEEYFMHESYDIDDVSKFTREWFAWANSFFGVLIDHIIETNPELIFS